MSFLNRREFEREIKKQIERNYHKVGQHVVDKINLMMEGAIGNPTKLTNAIRYEIKNNEINIVSDTPIPLFIDKGTKPYIIKPKNPRGVLAFKAQETITRKDGSKINFGEYVVTKEVKHPGIMPREFISAALFLSQKDFPGLLFDNQPPTSKQ